MQSVLIATLLFACVCLCAAQDPPTPKLPNIGFAGYGYNVFAGNPHATGGASDPGFGQVPVWALTYDDKTTTADGRWLIPDNVGIPGSAPVCVVSATTSTITAASDYQSSLSVDAKLDMTYFKASFSMSTNYKSVEHDTSSSKSVYVNTYAQCQTYYVNINSYIHPNLSSQFIKSASKLPTTFDPNNADAFWTFFDLVGTHYPSQMSFGSRWGYLFESSQSQWSTLNTLDLNIKVSASYAGLIKAGVSVDTTYAKSMAANFSSFTENTLQYSLGISPPASGKYQDWLVEAATSTLMNPLQYQLTEIVTLFTDDITSNPDILARHDAVLGAVRQYCQLHLLPAGKVGSCAGPPAPPPPKPTTAHTALAAPYVNNDPRADIYFSVVLDGTSAIQAQQLALQSCPGCSIAWTFDGACYALALAENKRAWAVATDTNGAISYCQSFSHGSACHIISSGCPSVVPGDANWGAIACDGSGNNPSITRDGGYPDRIEAHRVAMQQAGSGTFVAVDFNSATYKCGVMVRGDGGFAAAHGTDLNDATQKAMTICKAKYNNCNLGAHACIGSSLQSNQTMLLQGGQL